MAALLEMTSLSPASTGRELPVPAIDPARLAAGIAYTNRCLRGHRPFGIATGSAEAMAAFVECAAAHCEAREDLHLIRVTTPTDNIHAFLASCLAQLGFELIQAGLDDLRNLLIVFLRHEGARGRRTIAIIEGAEHCGPRVLEFMQTLARIRAGATPAMTFLLTGSRDLHRVLDSPGMMGLRQFTRERFDLDRSLAWVTPAGGPQRAARPSARGLGAPPRTDVLPHAVPGQLIVMLDGVILERRPLAPGRLVIGRSPQSGLRLDSRYVSRHHAALIISASSVTVIDLRSTNATHVNGKVATSQKLEHGDLVAIGNFRLRYDCRNGPQAVMNPDD